MTKLVNSHSIILLMKVITETEIMNFMYLDCGMKNLEEISHHSLNTQLMQFLGLCSSTNPSKTL